MAHEAIECSRASPVGPPADVLCVLCRGWWVQGHPSSPEVVVISDDESDGQEHPERQNAGKDAVLGALKTSTRRGCAQSLAIRQRLTFLVCLQVYAIDLLGFGHSDKPILQSGYSMEVWRDLVTDFCAEFTSGTQTTLVGNSIGGLVSLMVRPQILAP